MPLFYNEAVRSKSPEEFLELVHETFPEKLAILRATMGEHSPNMIALTKLLTMVYQQRQAQGIPGITPEELIVEILPNLVNLELEDFRLRRRIQALEEKVEALKSNRD